MKSFRHLAGVTTLRLAPERCMGCGLCATVCPHGVMVMAGGTAAIVDRDGCMECGACARNCPTQAITVTPGVGCAAAIIHSWLPWRRTTGCC